ncbi:serine-rich adhesin for platelets isoform X2 [Anabrus simplex]|uniref:serine-rich adhesin for platelets isoform X2 n=1 Tax=Anabrus simplex TaxID=316456 RepID=UPI0035A28C80
MVFLVPEVYCVPDSGGTPAMDCLPLQQRSPGPFHYLIHEQAKSLVALQELQNEVGALLEFRDLVMETFPHLQQKMASSSSSSRSVTNIPVPLSSARRTGEWEPGRVKRKPHHKEAEVAAPSSVRPTKALSQQPKSGEASGTSSAGSSAIQDSGFSSASKEKGSAASIFSSTKEKPQDSGFSSSSKDKGSAQTGDLDEAEDELWNLLDVIHRKGTRLREEVEHLQQRLRGEGEAVSEDDEMVGLRRERDYLLDKLAEMEAETLASRVRTSQLQTELGTLVAAKKDLEEQLRAAVTHKSELNSRIHDLHSQFVSGKRHSQPSLGSEVTDPGGRTRLGTLDGIISSPTRLPKVSADPDKVAAILQEFNPVELQRHLLTTAVQNKVLHKRLEKVSKSQEDLAVQLDKVKDENDDLRFQLEEKNIELEGTRARVRVLERLQTKCCSEQTAAVTPLPTTEDNIHHSSSTESAHDHTEVKTSSSPKKRPSKIPLPGLKSYTAPKPPSGKTAGKNKDSLASWKSKTDTFSFSGGKASSWKNRGDSNSSLLSGGGKSRESSSGLKSNSSLSGRQNSRESLSGNKSRSDSLVGKKHNGDSLSSSKTSHNSFSSSASNKKDSLPVSGRSKTLSSRRVSSTGSRVGELGSTDQNSKVRPTKLAFWSNWLKFMDNGPS